MTTTTTMLMPNDILRAAALFASTEATRYYLNGVYLESVGDKVRLTATDGKTLFTSQVHIILPETVKVIIPTLLLKKLPATKPRNNYVDITITGNKVSLTYMGMTVQGEAVDATFPDYRRIVPKELEEGQAQFDPDQVALFKKAGKILGAGGVPVLVHNGGGPALVRIVPNDHSKVYQCFGLVMPMTAHKADLSPPYTSWVHDA